MIWRCHIPYRIQAGLQYWEVGAVWGYPSNEPIDAFVIKEEPYAIVEEFKSCSATFLDLISMT